jgi:hypothetical protein
MPTCLTPEVLRVASVAALNFPPCNSKVWQVKRIINASTKQAEIYHCPASAISLAFPIERGVALNELVSLFLSRGMVNEMSFLGLLENEPEYLSEILLQMAEEMEKEK